MDNETEFTDNYEFFNALRVCLNDRNNCNFKKKNYI